MTVYQDQHGVWRYDFWQDLVRHRDVCLDKDGKRVTTKTDARKAELLERARLENEGAARKVTVRAGEYSLAQAQIQIVKRAVDRKRTREHIDNLHLWGDDILEYFGDETPFRALTQQGEGTGIDDYRNHVAAQPVRKWLGGKRKPTKADYANDALWKSTGKLRSVRQVNNYMMHLRKLLRIAAKVRDPVTRQPVLNQHPELEIELDRVPRRKPRPISDRELSARQAMLTPWVREASELSRLFGLRKDEALSVEIRHIDADRRALFWRGEEAKSGHDEHAFGGEEGWQLLQRLKRQAIARKQQRLITWPGPQHVIAFLVQEGRKGEGFGKTKPGTKADVPIGAWRPLRSLGSSWRNSAGRAGIDAPHRFHDVRARHITAVAQVNKAAAKDAARHQHSSTTDLYIRVADEEVAQAVAQANARRPKPIAGRPTLRSVR